MEKRLAVFNTDQVTRAKTRIPADVLMECFEDAYVKFIRDGEFFGYPVNMQHDMHRVIGWASILGICVDSMMVRTIGQIRMPTTKEEKSELENLVASYWKRYDAKESERYHDDLIERTRPKDGLDYQLFRREAVALKQDGIAAVLYPEYFSDESKFVDKDGLVDYRYLLQHTKLIQPGVFHDPKRDLILFAHRFFRRSLSHKNKLNAYFLERFQAVSIDNPELTMRLRLDPDVLGHPASTTDIIEMEWWRGPRFSEDISTIPSGVTEHKADERQRQLQGIDRTHIWWKNPESRQVNDHTYSYRTLEAEELIDNPSWGISENHYGCRYIHAEYSYADKAVTHFDGAIRAYGEEQYLERLDTYIDKAGKKTDYTKLFRVDGNFAVDKWKRLLTDFFQGNPLIPEYLGALPEDESERVEATEEEVINGAGLAAFVTLRRAPPSEYRTQLWVERSIQFREDVIPVVEVGTGAIRSYLRERLDLDGLVIVGFQDSILNLATLQLDLLEDPENTFSREMEGLAEALHQDVQDGVITYASIPIAWKSEGGFVVLTVAGEAAKVVQVLKRLPEVVTPTLLPSSWIEQLSTLIKTVSPERSLWELNKELLQGFLVVERSSDTTIQLDVPDAIRDRIMKDSSQIHEPPAES